MNKTVTAQVSLSTNPAVAGRFFVDVRDTTNGAFRQMTTRTTDTPAAFIAELAEAAKSAGVTVSVDDTTGELA